MAMTTFARRLLRFVQDWQQHPRGRRHRPSRRLAAATIGIGILMMGAPTVSARTAAPAQALGTLPAAVSGVHYLYAEVVNGGGSLTIDVFRMSGSTLTAVQAVPAAGTRFNTYYGAHNLAVAPANATHGPCLIVASGADGTLRSFGVGPGGLLALPPASIVSVGGQPEDVRVAAGSSLIAVSNINSHAVDTLQLGSGCAMKLLGATSTGSEVDYDWQFLSPSVLVTADETSGRIEFYRVSSTGLARQFASRPGQIQGSNTDVISGPDGVDVLTASTPSGTVQNVYTGIATDLPPSVQGFQASSAGSITPLKGSPSKSKDATSANGAAILVDPQNRLLLQATQNTYGFAFTVTDYAHVAWYGITPGAPGKPGSIAYKGDTQLAAGNDPTQLLELGSVLFVAMVYRGDVEACAVATTGVSGCKSVATLTAGSTNGGSIAIW